MAKAKTRKRGMIRLPKLSGLRKDRAVRGLSLRADTVKTYCQFVADKCSWLGWGPKQLAEASGVGNETCWRHMSGQVTEPRLTTATLIMNAMKVEVKLLEPPKRK